MRPLQKLALLALMVPLSGCLTGWGPIGLIYKNATVPLDANLTETPAYQEGGDDNTKRIQYAGLSIDWDSNAIGEIAKAKGMGKVYYADLKIFSILGIWTQTTVEAYGQ